MQADALDLDANVQETLERSAGTDAQLSDIKALLGRMMFTGKSVHKKVSPGSLVLVYRASLLLPVLAALLSYWCSRAAPHCGWDCSNVHSSSLCSWPIGIRWPPQTWCTDGSYTIP